MNASIAKQEVSQLFRLGQKVLYNPRYAVSNRNYSPLYTIGVVMGFTDYRVLVDFGSVVAFFHHHSLEPVSIHTEAWGLQ